MKLRPAERALAYVVMVLIAIVGIAPFVVLFLVSTRTRLGVLQVPPPLTFELETFLTNYRQVIFDRFFLEYTINSVVVTGLSTLIALVIGLPAAYAFSRIRFRASDQWASTILSFRFMPPVAVAIPIFLLIRNLGLADSYLGLILPYVAFTLPLVIWILIGFFDEVPREIDDAALVDGCSRLGVLTRVMLPLVRPGMMVAAIFGVIFIWNELLVGVYVISSEDIKTIPVGAAGLISAQRPLDWNIAATVGMVTILPIFIFSLFVQRYILRGVTAGAVK
ncbi:MAG: carbohydrate ABC transporter permease [Chloroflexi bacterium]|jgi:multiple sugar transport system permease protein|nr:carbohydrate ABC transporter permease [Chloroflexota bacterium]